MGICCIDCQDVLKSEAVGESLVPTGACICCMANGGKFCVSGVMGGVYPLWRVARPLNPGVARVYAIVGSLEKVSLCTMNGVCQLASLTSGR